MRLRLHSQEAAARALSASRLLSAVAQLLLQDAPCFVPDCHRFAVALLHSLIMTAPSTEVAATQLYAACKAAGAPVVAALAMALCRFMCVALPLGAACDLWPRITGCHCCTYLLEEMADADEGARRELLHEAAERAELLPALLRAINPAAPPAAPQGGRDERELPTNLLRARVNALNLYRDICMFALDKIRFEDEDGRAAGNRMLWAVMNAAGLPAALGRAIADACPMLLVPAYRPLELARRLSLTRRGGDLSSAFERGVPASAPAAAAALASPAVRAALMYAKAADDKDLAAVLEWLQAAQAGGTAAAASGAAAPSPPPQQPQQSGEAAPAAAPAAPALPPYCCVCGAIDDKLRACGRCRSPGLRYCDVECQRAHWRAGHKAECQQLQAAAAAASSNDSR